MIFVVIGINFRFSSIAAAKANSFVNSDDEWITNVKLDENEVHLFYDTKDDIYRTVYVRKLTYSKSLKKSEGLRWTMF